MTDLYKFLGELAENNNRPWFEANRPRYQQLRDQWLSELDRMIQAMAQWDPAIGRQTARQAAYRIYRDTRFSLDKTPYKTYFSAAMGPYGRSSGRAGYYLQHGNASFARQGLYVGLWEVTTATLNKIRRAIVDNLEEWQQIVENPQARGDFQWCSDQLKTIPKGWPRNHPQAHYLRMTNYGLYLPLPDSFFARPDWPERAAELLRPLKPLVYFLNYSIDE